MSEKRIFQDKNQLSIAAADFFVEKAIETLANKRRFLVSLSGGSTPKALFELLSKKEYSDKIEWNKVYFFWGDERCVPPTHKDSNYLMTKISLLDNINIPEENIFRIKGELPPKKAAENYRNRLNIFFTGKAPCFDLCFLGMGDDGHTASLFPGTEAIFLKRKRVKEVYVKKFDSWRITLTASVINNSKTIAFLVAGASKNPALKEVLEGEYQPNLYPSQLIRAAKNEVIWFLDKGAAGKK